MKSEMKKWFVTVLAVGVIMTVGTAEAGYYAQRGPDAWTVEDDPADTQTSTMKEYTNVDCVAGENGYCYCYVRTRAWAKAVDAALADASGTAYWEISWEWEGPPSTPAGGTLSWDIDAWGAVFAWGDTDPGDGGSAYSSADADSCAWIARTGGTFSGGANAYGSVEDDEMASGDAYLYGSATVGDGPTKKDPDFGSYQYCIYWDLDGADDDTIAAGTSYVQVLAGAHADGSSLATASGSGSDAEAEAETFPFAHALAEASFESN